MNKEIQDITIAIFSIVLPIAFSSIYWFCPEKFISVKLLEFNFKEEKNNEFLKKFSVNFKKIYPLRNSINYTAVTYIALLPSILIDKKIILLFCLIFSFMFPFIIFLKKSNEAWKLTINSVE